MCLHCMYTQFLNRSWHIMDRLLAAWHFLIGTHLLGTPWLNIVYYFLGAKIESINKCHIGEF